MRVAIVHELLTMRGGAERVLRVIAEMFPEAPIYTLLYDERKLGDWFPKERVRTSPAQPHFPLSIFHFPFNHHLRLGAFPTAVEAWPFDGVHPERSRRAQGDSPRYDLVLSTSSAFAHGIITNGAPKHLCYVHSPARYLWDRTHDVLERASHGFLGPLKKAYLSRLFHRLRIWDSEAADRPDTLIAASKEVQRRIELYWRRESEVIHPPIDDVWLKEKIPSGPGPEPGLPAVAPAGAKGGPESYYLVVSQLAHYKKIDLAIRACNRRKQKLIIAGEGPARRSLEAIAGPTIEFVGYQKDDELRTLYANARATLFPGEEDFGLVPLESLACGTPVIAYRGGGALETLTEQTAEFFDTPTSESLADAMERAERRPWKTDQLQARAREFSRGRFEEKLRGAIARMMEQSSVTA